MRAFLTTLATLSVAAALPNFAGSYNDDLAGHRQFGIEVGTHFKKEIHERIAQNEVMQKIILPYIAEGGASYHLMKQLEDSHKSRYPLFYAEIEGMSQGCNISTEELFAMNLKQEVVMLMNETDSNEQCSDYSMIHTICHNEDSEKSDVGKTGFFNITFSGKNFMAYTYFGDLPSGAFGFTPGNVAFTLNRVSPATGSKTGYGRGFISRDLLTAKSWDDAMSILRTPMIGGHNYQLLNMKNGDVAVVEVGHDRGTVHDIPSNSGTPFFHANHYLLLDIPQVIDTDSLARVNRAKQMPVPKTIPEALSVLGDQFNKSYPIFHDTVSHSSGDATGLWTLQTVTFEWSTKGTTMTVYEGNPKLNKVIMTISAN
eukprot:TRINITY_DN6117_c2_g1_i1.p1 TRINITY_DN6117_c2_g1~~TRINITY_DN6117_c2_g1_i1.p1  ORF type:complete len:370 (+),score=68.08 TRINITY_DN6117_c2_g1_i1:120-1229(+)